MIPTDNDLLKLVHEIVQTATELGALRGNKETTMNFDSLAQLMNAKVELVGEKDRTLYAVLTTSEKTVLLLQREWNGKTVWMENPTEEEKARIIDNPFFEFSNLTNRLV